MNASLGLKITNHKHQMTNNTKYTMIKNQNRPYDLEDRTLEFARGVIKLCRRLPKCAVNLKLIGQLVSAVGSVGANYIEANEALSKKDFLHRMRISRKECKEGGYWLELLKEGNSLFIDDIAGFIRESRELRNIFTSIIEKSR